MIDMIIFIFSLLFLFYASYSDLKTRTVPNELWYFVISISIFVAIYKIMIYNYAYIVVLVYSFLVTSIISYILYELKMFGGADFKCIVCISLLIPTINIPFSITVLINSILASLIIPSSISIKNLMSKSPMRISTLNDVKNLFSCYKLSTERFKRCKNMRVIQKEGDEVLVTPEIPFTLFITFGFIISILFGNWFLIKPL